MTLPSRPDGSNVGPGAPPLIGRRQLVALAITSALPLAGHAQSFPARPVSIVVPFPPGGTTDIAARAIALEMGKLLGQSVTVDNRAGAGGNVGGEFAVRAAPNGYTLFMTTTNIHAINPLLYSKMSFDPNKDFAPVAPLLLGSLVLLLHPSVKANNVKELIAFAKANPGRLTVASAGAGTINHLAAELFKKMAGVYIVHVPYRGAAPALADLIGGQVDMMIDGIASAIPHIRTGKLRGIATSGAKRSDALPELPTIAEAGLPGFEATFFFGLLAPAGTPREVIQRLNAEATKGANTPEFRERMSAAGLELVSGSADKLADMIRTDVARWAPVVKATGMKID